MLKQKRQPKQYNQHCLFALKADSMSLYDFESLQMTAYRMTLNYSQAK